MKFQVLRQHFGDRLYQAGEEREANQSDVAHLVDSGVLAAKPERKAEPRVANKAEAAVENKARK